MELDELKKSWNALDKHLPQSPLTDEQKIAELLERYRKNTRKSLRSLIGFQRFSLVIGGIALLACLFIGYAISTLITDAETRGKAYVMLAFFVATMIGGTWWDYKTYRWTNATRVDEMSVSEVSRRMVTFRRWTGYEVCAICVWALLFDLLYCWAMDFFQYNIWVPIGAMCFLVVFEAVVIISLYRTFIYRHLNNIKRNMEELEDVCTE